MQTSCSTAVSIAAAPGGSPTRRDLPVLLTEDQDVSQFNQIIQCLKAFTVCSVGQVCQTKKQKSKKHNTDKPKKNQTQPNNIIGSMAVSYELK